MFKKLLTLLLLFFVFNNNAKSTHVVSADLTYECLGGLNYKFTLKLYRDCSGQSIGTFQAIDYSSASLSSAGTFILFQDSSYEVSQVCDSLLPMTTCNSGTLPGMEVYIYSANFTLPDSASDWNFENKICCRSTAITNLTSGFSFYTNTTLNNLDGKCNDSPTFKAIPLLYSCANETVNFNSIAIDKEGDSLSFKLVRTWGDDNLNIPYSSPAFNAANPFSTTAGITFDSLTGQVTFNSSSMQQAILTILITEYDAAGNVKGTHRRDVQFIFIVCPPPPFNPYTTGVDYDTSNYTYTGCYNTPISFDVYSVSFDTINPIVLNYYSNIPNATFTTTVNKDTTFGTFSWIPGTRLGNYYFRLQTVAKTCPLKRQNIFNYTIHIDTVFSACKDTTLYLSTTGYHVIDSSHVLDFASSGNCPIQSVTLSKDTFDCDDLGVNPVSVTTVYQNGLVRTCTANVTLIDTISPVSGCVDTTIYLNASGFAVIDSSFVHDFTIVSCGTATIGLSKYIFTCSDVGANTVALVVTEVNGLKDTCYGIVTVVDTFMPNAVCIDTTIYLDTFGQAIIDSSFIENGSSDNCVIVKRYLSQTSFDCTNIGSNTVTLYAEDFFGNVDSCQANVNVLDTNAINVSCKDTTVYLSGGIFNLTVSDVDAGNSSVCGATNATLDKYIFTCADTGSNSVKLLISNSAGDKDSCFASVTVIDTSKITFSCKDTTVYLNSLGFVAIDSSFVLDSFQNNTCNLLGISVSNDTFRCSDIGANFLTTNVLYRYGSSYDSCTSIITVLDTISPVANCQNISVYLDASGNAVIDSSNIENGSTDNCGISTISLSKYTFDCGDVGVNNVIMRVTDVNGNMSSCSATVSVYDTIRPEAICADTTLYLNSTGNIVIDSSFINNGSYDSCGIATISINNNTFNCAQVGANTVTMIVTDVNGNFDTCSSTVTVLDTLKPIVSCQNVSIYLDATGNAVIDSSNIDNGSTDNCGIATIVLSQTNFNCSNIGINNVTMTVTDVNGNQDTCLATVTVIDSVNPNAICQDTTVYLSASGIIVIDSSFINNGSNDNCGIYSITLNKDTFDCSSVGANWVTIIVTDVNGNVDSCSSIVTVLDTLKPVANCTDTTIYLNTTGNFTIDSSFINNGVSVNCGIATISINNNTFNCAQVGANTVTMIITDVNGNFDTCSSTVTVLDTLKPIVSCQNVSIYLDATGNAVIDSSNIDNGSTDNCGIATIVLSQTNFNCSNIGINNVTMTVTDVNGNQDTCLATVTVIDSVNPNAVCKDTTVYLSASGIIVIDSSFINNGSNDNCDIYSITLNKDTFDCSSVGANWVTIIVTDVNGNVDSCSSIVTVLDTLKPVANCVDTTIYVNTSGNFTIDSSYVSRGSGNNCGIATMNINNSYFDCSQIGANTVTMIVTDVNGNFDTCSSTVTVLDTLKPIVSYQNVSIYLDATGNAVIDSSNIDNGSTDNCGIATIVLSQTNFNCSNIGINNVTMTVTDVNGNQDTCSAIVTVLDTINPSAVCKDTTVYINSLGFFTIDTSFIENGSFDNCSLDSIRLSKYTFNCSDVGLDTIQLYAYDNSGNIDSCSAIINVVDTTNPIAACADTTIYLNTNGTFVITSSFVNGGFSYGCPVSSIVLSKDTFDCNNIGTNNVTMSVRDVNGNIDSCTAIITVLDTIKPTVICQNISAYLNNLGVATIDSAMINNGSFDNCGIWKMTLSQTSFDCTQLGIHSVTLVVTDYNGNIDSCSSVVTIFDTIKPNTICKDTTIYLNAAGKFTIDSTFTNNGSTDNCGIASISLSKYNFDCGDVGLNNFTMVVTDVNGNIDSCIAMVTVLDTVNPLVLCKNSTVYLNASGAFNIDSSWIDNGSYDSCGIATMSISQSVFDCTNLGVNNVTMVATDINGNSDSCVSSVTVLDTLKPIVNCQNISVYLNSLGAITIDSSMIDNGSTDNCGIAKMVISQSNFNCTQIGTNSLTLTVTDVNGNVNTCSAIVTVYDTIKPMVICKDTTIYLDVFGNFVIDSSYIDNGSSDNCGIETIELSKYQFDCSNVGVNPVSIVVTDVNGNIDSCLANVTVIDTIIPTSYAGADTNICGYLAIQLNGTAALPHQMGTWSCLLPSPSIPTITNVNNPKSNVSGLNIGTYYFIWSVTNGSGCNITRDTVQINILDTLFAFAGPDISLCNQFTTSLMGVPTVSGTYGMWSSIIGTPPLPTITNPTTSTSGVSNLSEGTFHFIWTVNNGLCAAVSDTAIIDVYDLPISNAGLDQNLCAIYSTSLNGNSPLGRARGEWSILSSTNSSSPVFTDSNLYNTTINGLQEGTYNLVWTVRNGTCPPDIDTVVINVYDMPNAMAGVDTIICDINSLQLFATAPIGTSTGQWNEIPLSIPPGVTFSDSSLHNSTVSNLNIGSTQFLTWTISNGTCPDDIDTVEIQIQARPIVDAGNDTSICANYSVSINALPLIAPATGYWYVDSSSAPNIPSFTDKNNPSTTVSGLIEGTYSFIWRGMNLPCFDIIDTVQISIFNQHTAVVGVDQFLCNQPQTTISGNVVPGTATTKWYLESTSLNIPTFDSTQSTTNLGGLNQGGVYSMVWEIQNGVCPVSRDTIIVTNQFTPVASLIQDKVEVCQGETVNFNSSSTMTLPQSVTTEVWELNGNTYSSPFVNEQFNTPGYHGVTLTITATNGCLDTLQKDSAVFVHTNPIANFSIDYTPNTLEIEVNNQAQFACCYLYDFGDGNTSTLQDPIHTFSDTGNRRVIQIVANPFGCVDSISKTVYVQYLSAYIANAFTPNDDGTNDVFKPVVSGHNPSKYEFTIYDRWGEMIFRTESSNEGWDGKFKGQKVPVGVYVWTLTSASKIGGKVIPQKGHVTLIR